MKLSGVSDSVKTNGEAAIPSSPAKPVAQTGNSSRDDNPIKSKCATAGSKSPIKPIGKTGASSSPNLGVRGRASVSPGTKGKAIVSDNVGEESVIQGFIPYGRIETYLPHMKAGCTYRLNKFFGSKSNTIYRVAEPDVTISFSWNSVLSVLEDSSIRFPEDQFRIHGVREFDAASELRGDLYDYIGHIKLVNGKVPSDSLLLDEAEIAAPRRVELHVQTHDDPVMKLYLWDKAAFEFCEKFKASGGTAFHFIIILLMCHGIRSVIGILSLSAMASSRVFLDSDVQETLFYLNWLNSNLDVASRVNAEVVVKPEPATLGELFSYMNQASSKVAWFECTTTIDDVVHGLDAVFVVLGDADEELTGKNATELVERYYQANDSVGGDHIVPVPQAMIDTIGQTRKFIAKVLPPDAPEPEGNLGENVGEKVILRERIMQMSR
ncbi:hypothetical protein Bca52824_052483 [Brassica carinata]|uniref:Uncharacterized protein n=1 Tax=Brassica carinata TaxID=52824 RepID=A0A8X7R4T9_BRACI|nr:hypothetical protein Bca52824_052483 [Brassica carinata]